MKLTKKAVLIETRQMRKELESRSDLPLIRLAKDKSRLLEWAKYIGAKVKLEDKIRLKMAFNPKSEVAQNTISHDLKHLRYEIDQYIQKLEAALI